MKERWTPAYDRLFDRHYELNGGEPFCRTMAWLWICHHAQFEDGTRIIRDEPLMLKRGEILGSLRWFAEQWGWSVKRVRTFLDYLHDCGKLGTVRGTAKGTVYRVVNYGLWRSTGTAKGTEKGAVGAQGIEVYNASTPRVREGGDVENSTPASTLEKLGVRSEAIDALRQLPGVSGLTLKGIAGQYGPNGTRAQLWRGVDPSLIGDLISTAMLRTADESERWHGIFFARVIERLVEDELAPSPAEQAKARSAKTPAGRITAEQEAERDRKKAEQARAAREAERDRREKEKAEAEEAEAGEVLRWLEEQGTEVVGEARSRALQGLRQIGFRDPPEPMIRSYIVQAAKEMRETLSEEVGAE